MSLKQEAIRSNAKATLPESTTEHTGTDNGWTVDLSGYDSESEFARRFWKKVERRNEDECWPWIGNQIAKSGRGQVHIRWEGGKNIRRYAPIVAWELTNRTATPAGYVIAHSCDNPNCVNPTHLRACTQAENLHESLRKGRFNAWGIQKLNEEQVLAIRARGASGEHQRTIAAAFGIARNTVSQILNHKTWAHLQGSIDRRLTNVEPVRTVDLPVDELHEIREALTQLDQSVQAS